MDKKLTVMVTQEQLEQFKEAAHIRRVSLSEWVRKVLDANAKNAKEQAHE